MSHENAHAGTPDAADWSPAFTDEMRQQREAEGKWCLRRKIDDEGPGRDRAECCGRGNVPRRVMVWVTPPIRALLERLQEEHPAALREMQLNPDAEYLCDGCSQKLRLRWRSLGRAAVLDTPAYYFALGAPPEVVELGRQKARMGRAYGRNPDPPMHEMAREELQERGYTEREPRSMPAPPAASG